ncbi:MAG: ATP-binding protein [Candidatus Aenigmarchaeota archaeon]|nr:ATP-binding protein [Candidatus Aenigmarchaeota archaeon]
MIRFINRERDLRTLEKLWKLENCFVVVYGRRRIGKTRLVEEFLKDKEGISYTVEDVNRKIQIREFKNALASFLNDEFLRNQEIDSWSSLFSYLEKTLDLNKRFYIWIDEFSHLVKNDPSLTSVLQRFIDKVLRRSKIFFIVSGSIFGIIKEKVLSHSSPLYGRRTKDILLTPLSFPHAAKFLNFNFEDSLKTYMSMGGIPEYLLVASRYDNFFEFISAEFFERDGYFYREPYFLLSREFKEIKTYFSILNAISYGNTTPTEIANFIGIKTREIYPYLELLIAFGFLERVTPIFGKKKASIYVIKDVFFDFWFNFVHKNRGSIERGIYKVNLKELNPFFGKRFEYFVLDIFHLLFPFPKIGKWWHKDNEIDIVGLNEKTKEVLFCECKWKARANAEKICRELAEKAQYVQWHSEKRKESFAIFAKSFSKQVGKFDGKKVYCFDLRDLERLFK